MSDTSKVARRINEEAQKRADSVIQSAKAEAESVLSSANADAAAIKTAAMQTADEFRKSRESYLKSRVRREFSQGVLAAKREIIESVISAAKDAMTNAPADEYFADLARWIAQNAHEEPGVIIMNAKDIARLPKGFVEKAGGGKLRLLEGAVSSGCVLRYENDNFGAVEENGTIEARFDAKAFALTDVVAGVLLGTSGGAQGG